MNRRLRALLPWLVLLPLCASPASAQDDTPRAGAGVDGTLFGRPIHVEPRDRGRVDALWAAVQWLPSGPEQGVVSPQGAFYVWRTPEDGRHLRAILLGILDDVRAGTPLGGGFELVATFENTTLPWARADVVEGRRLSGEELRWSTLRAGIGAGIRRPVGPRLADSWLEASLAYEPGLLLFRRSDETLPGFREPSDAYEGRLHARFRVDAIERNLLERPHAGFAAGVDAVLAHRAGWRDWGGGPTGPHAAAEGRSWSAVTGHALAALPVPFVRGSRHRLLLAVHAGAGDGLDRFSALRLSGGSNAGDAETLVQPILPGAALDEIATRGFVIADAEYRWEALFWLYFHLRGTWARVDRERSGSDGVPAWRVGPLNAVTAGLTSGFLWNSTVELFVSRSAGLEDREGAPGRTAAWLSFTLEF